MPGSTHSQPDAAAATRTVLKDEPATRIERIGCGDDAVVSKTYRNLGLRRLQSCFRPSRARREYDNLRAVEEAALPCTPPVRCSEQRRLCCVSSSELVTRFLPDCQPVKQWLQQLPPDQWQSRRWLVAQMGQLLAGMHQHGLLWCTPMPRNFLLQGPPGSGRVLLCDLPALVRFPHPIHATKSGLIDLFDAVTSPSRRREFSRGEQLRYLRAYCLGDRKLARRLLRQLRCRGPLGQRLRKNLVMAGRTYILGFFQRRPQSSPTHA